MTRMAPLLRWRKRGNVSAPSPPTFYYRRGTFRCCVSLLNQLSTRLSQEAPVGVKCCVKRGWAASHVRTVACLWLP